MHKTESEGRRRGYLLLSLIVNLSILGFFKYFNFFLEGAVAGLALLGLEGTAWRLDVVLPLGISFYTFKTLSYTLDVHGRQMEPAQRFVDYATFVAFFPQLSAGPIDRAANLLPQIQEGRTIDRECLRVGSWLFLWGLFKKLVVADNLVAVVDRAFAPGADFGTAYAWVATYSYALQLYCDFSGYTDMARGIARLMGFHTAINFKNPFFATNPVEFWQRWHISLSAWIQDYIYFPMAAAFMRRNASLGSQTVAPMLTMILMGLWHGAKLTAVGFGVFLGLLIVMHIAYRAWARKFARKRGPRAKKKPDSGFTLRRVLLMTLFFHAICLGFVIFRSATLPEAFRLYGILFDPGGGLWLFNGFGTDALNAALAIVLLYAPVLAVQIAQELTRNQLCPLDLPPMPRALLFAVIVLMLLLLGNTGGEAFIYQQF